MRLDDCQGHPEPELLLGLVLALDELRQPQQFQLPSGQVEEASVRGPLLEDPVQRRHSLQEDLLHSH